MKKILLLVFVHGFCGDDDTFGSFPPYIQGLISHSLPRLTVVSKVYPKYETRGELSIAVNKLRSWLQDTVMEIEVSNKNKYPTTEPSVRTIFVCHSMGGIVAAEAFLGITKESKVGADPLEEEPTMWPFIQGILAFDTPYLGLAPQMFAHTGAGGIKTANEALEQVKSIASWWAGGITATTSTASSMGSQGTTTATSASTTSTTTSGVLMVEEKRVEKERERKSGSSSHSRRESKSERSERRESKNERSERRETKGDKNERRESKIDRRDSKTDKHERRESRSERVDRREGRSEHRSSRHEHRSSNTPDRPKSERKSSSFSQKDSAAAAATAVAAAPDIPLPQSPINTTPPTSPSSPTNTSGTSSLWSKWSKVALYAGAAATLAAAGATAYKKRTEITTGFSWATSHIEFVGVLMKGDQLRHRLRSVISIPNVGFANLYTSMGPNSLRSPLDVSVANSKAQEFLRQERTFCSEPTKDSEFRKYYRKQINEKAKDEIEMHTGMFGADQNPNYYVMCGEARDLVVEWVENNWVRRF